jgi:tetratricopeptide (TPR) repeat protein
MSGRDIPADEPDADAGGSMRDNNGGRQTSHAHDDWFGSLNQLDFDIDFFEGLLARNGDSVEVLRVLAELVSQKGLVKRAVELDRRLVEVLPNDFLARYNLACSLARAGRPDEAIDALSRAILLGYDDLAHLEVDPDLDSLREHPEFRELLGHE